MSLKKFICIIMSFKIKRHNITRVISCWAAGVSGGKDECQVRLKGREHDYWMGTEVGMLKGYGFQDQVTAGDGSDKQGKMGAGYNKLRRKKKKQQCKVGSEEEGSSSNQPELAAFFLAQRRTSTTCCFSSLTTCFQCGTRTLSWIEPKNWWRRQLISMQNTLLQSLTGVAQSKKE